MKPITQTVPVINPASLNTSFKVTGYVLGGVILLILGTSGMYFYMKVNSTKSERPDTSNIYEDETVTNNNETLANGEVYSNSRYKVGIPASWKKAEVEGNALTVVSAGYIANSPFSEDEKERYFSEVMPVKSGSMIKIYITDGKTLSQSILDPAEYVRFKLKLANDYAGFVVSKEMLVDGVPSAFVKVRFENGTFATYISTIRNGEEYSIHLFTTDDEIGSKALESTLISFHFVK